MFKRIRSKRDPGDTVWTELHKEFGRYFERAGAGFGKLCAAYPNFVFGVMVCLLLLSGVLSFTVLRRKDRRPATTSATLQSKPATLKSPHPVDEGFARILATGAALQQTLALKKEVESILTKDRLSAADSVVLNRALDSLQQLQTTIPN